jgi:type I restriction enzyme S subunit
MSDASFESHKIRDLISGYMSGPSPSCEEREIASAEEWGLLKTTAVTWQGWDPTAHKVPPPEYWKNYRIEVKRGDVLVTKAGPRHRVGVVVYVDRTPPRLMVSGKMIGLRPDPAKVDRRVLAAALSQNEPQRFLDNRTTGMADSQLNFTNELLLNTIIKLPPKPEQTKISEILLAMDRAIEQTEALIAKQQRIKTGLIQDLLSRGIDKHGNLRSERTHPFKTSSLGRIPVDWEATPISSVLAAPPKNGYSPVESNVWNGSYVLGLGCLTVDGFRPKQLKFAPPATPSIEAARLEPGDFLISRSNTRALVGLVGTFKLVDEPCIYPDLMVRLIFTSEVCTDYMEQVFRSAPMRRQIENAATGTSGSMVKISGPLIKRFAFLRPPVDEQGRILSVLKAQDSYLDDHIRSLGKLRSLKTGLMQDLLNGNKRVTPLLGACNLAEAS